jgi:hypothetical protein
MALVLIATGGVLFFTPGEKSPQMKEVAAACLRLGPLLVAVWLAYDHLKRIPLWLYLAVLVVAVVAALRPRTLWLLIPLLILLAILKPRPRRDG